MKKNYFIAVLALVVNFVSAQIEPTSYRGAFAPAPTAMWTDSWTNWDPKNETYPDAATVVNVTTNITTNTTWTTGKTYYITGLIYVTNNATLTIQPGVIVKGVFSNTGTALVITKGAKLNAVGTAASPIVFTSAKTVAQGRSAGDWGGIILLGKAGFNLNNGVNNIEGITATVNTEYGGGALPKDTDSSGSLKYVRIEFGGFVFSPNNEINGLTFGAVGSGTSIDYVQVSYSGDDSFEWFGGAVNCKHLVAYRGLDDDFDTDNGYKGIVQFALGIKDPLIADNPAISTSEGFESDNNASATVAATGYDNTTAIFTNCTLVGPALRATLAPTATIAAGHARALRLRRLTQLKVYNSIFMDFKNNYLFLDGTAANANAGLLKFKNNIIAGTPDATYTGGVNPTSQNSWFTANSNSFQSSSTGLLTLPYNAATNTYLGLDYRPGTTSPAFSGADFSDSALTAYIVTATGTTPLVNNVSYCKKDIVAPLTATLTTTGVSLNWYAAATGGTPLATAPTPLTTTAGTKDYWVSQISNTGIESARVKITVTVNDLPTEVLGAITGTGPEGSVSAVAVGKYVGTTAQFTYTIPAFVNSSLSYLWTVPLGVNIVSGQGTNSITVNYANVSYGAGTVGSIQCQAVNASGCKTGAKVLAITKALPKAPASIKILNTNEGYPTPAIAITKIGPYLGTNTILTLTAGASIDGTSFKWELPTGVTLYIPSGVTPVITNVTYTAEPFFAPGSTPSTVGTKFWVVTYNAYTFDVNGVSTTVTTSTAVQKIVGSGAYGATTSAPYAPYGTVITSDQNSILVSFAGITSPTTNNTLYLGVKAKNGVGYSVTSNATNTDVVANNNISGLYNPTYTEAYTAPVPPSTNATSTYSATGITPSLAKLLKVTAALPTAPTAVAGQIIGLCGGNTYSYSITTANYKTGATGYSITAPTGSVVTSASNSSNASNVLTTTDATFSVTYPIGFTVTTTTAIPEKSLVIYSRNVVGASLLAKTITLSTSMAAIGIATGSAGITSFTRCATQTFTIPAAIGATSYTWTPANGAVIVNGQGTNTVEVDFSAVPTTVTKTILKVAALNSCAISSTAKSITLLSVACGAKTDRADVAVNSTIELYPNPASDSFNIDMTLAGNDAVTMSIITIDGSVVSTRKLEVTEGFNTVNENISSLRTGIYFIQLVNETTNETIVKKLVKK